MSTLIARSFGQRVLRNEDDRLLRGQGCYVDDVPLPGAFEVAFLRSPHAHARITRLDASPARTAEGVVAVFTAADLEGLPQRLPLLFPHPSMPHGTTQRPLADVELDYVGQTIAMVVATSRYLAEDAVELIEIEYELLPVVADVEDAAAGGPLVHDIFPTNVAADHTQTVGDPDGAFARAEVTVRERYVCERAAAMPIETRGVAARYERGQLDVWDSTQCALPVQAGLVGLLGLPEDRVRVIAPDTGGGFGVKGYLLYPEEVLIPWAAMRLEHAVRWSEDRAEHFFSSNHQRSQVHTIELAATRDGTIVGLRDEFLHDQGAFIAYGLITPEIAASHIAGPYRIPNISVRFQAVYTNRVPVSPYRSVGRPQACFAVERAIDRLARELGMDKVEVRRRNLVGKHEFPYRRDGLAFAGYPVELDSGDYEAQLDQILDAVGYQAFAKEQEAARAEGRYLGLGLACYVEGTGEGPYEGAHVLVQASTGKVEVRTGLTSQGQSHKTTLAQIAAEQLGVAPADVIVTQGDSGAFRWGAGTFGSRAIVNSGNAVALAAAEVRERAVSYAANMLEAAAEDLTVADGKIFVAGSPDRAVTLKQIAIAVNPIRYQTFDPEVAVVAGFAPARAAGLRPDESPGLEATSFFVPPATAWTSGMQAAIVEVDVETGQVAYRRYVIANDCGRMVNPSIVEGQIMGGVALGIAGSLYERMAYDAEGQLQNASFADFLMPYATEIPELEIVHQETPSPLNALGIKGAGEAGSIAGPAVTASAIDDALAPFGIEITHMPIDPSGLRDLLRPLVQ